MCGLVGDDLIFGGGGSDQLIGDRGHDSRYGGGGRDEIAGGDGNDVMRGDGGRDHLLGRTGNDDLDGGGGKDVLASGSGNDTISGGRGADDLTSGSGADVFHFETGDGSDIIRDFERDEDLISIGSGATGFSHLDISQSGKNAIINFADVKITLFGEAAKSLGESDFIF